MERFIIRLRVRRITHTDTHTGKWGLITWAHGVSGIQILAKPIPLQPRRQLRMKTNRIRIDITDIVFVFKFVFEYEVGYG